MKAYTKEFGPVPLIKNSQNEWLYNNNGRIGTLTAPNYMWSDNCELAFIKYDHHNFAPNDSKVCPICLKDFNGIFYRNYRPFKNVRNKKVFQNDYFCSIECCQKFSDNPKLVSIRPEIEE